jgi:predicted hydrocarbon binding protein
MAKSPDLNSVTVPEEMKEEFLKAQEVVAKYFETTRSIPEEGKLLSGRTRYIAMPAEFITRLRERIVMSGSEQLADLIIYEVAKDFGKRDAHEYIQMMNVTDPIQKLSAGPVQFSYRGFAHVKIFPISNPKPDESYLLVYDHLNSFEVEAYKDQPEKATSPRCFFNAGYSAGWCEVSFSVPIQAREITCQAMEDPFCRFVMAHKDHILEHITPEAVEKYKQL